MHGYNGYGSWGYGNMMGSFGSGIMMFVVWALVIIFILWIAREVREKNSKSSGNVIEILKERYAKGEITKEQFETMEKDIN